MAKRRADTEIREDNNTPIGKKLRPGDKGSAAVARRTRRSDPENAAPPFVVQEEEEAGDNMAANDTPNRSRKPPSAEEFRAMLKDGLANVARTEQLEQMMVQIKSNSNALVSLERKVDCTNEANEIRFRTIEDRLDAGHTSDHDRDPLLESKKAAFDKARRSMRVWPIAGDDEDQLDAAFRDFAVDALQVPDVTVRQANITNVIRVRSSPHNKIYKEILVSFGDPQERDYYFSKARNLAGFRDAEGNPTAGTPMGQTLSDISSSMKKTCLFSSK